MTAFWYEAMPLLKLSELKNSSLLTHAGLSRFEVSRTLSVTGSVREFVLWT